MNEYLIGAGALLTAGPASSLVGATLHAQTEPGIASRVEAAVIDFEAARPAELSRIVIVAAGWRARDFEEGVSQPLLARGDCTLADVFETMARATGAREVHLFARWLPDAVLGADLRRRGVEVVAHPLEDIGQAALISGQRHARWQRPFRAA